MHRLLEAGDCNLLRYVRFHRDKPRANTSSPEWQAHLIAHDEFEATQDAVLGILKTTSVVDTMEKVKFITPTIQAQIESLRKVLDTNGELKYKDGDEHWMDKHATEAVSELIYPKKPLPEK